MNQPYDRTLYFRREKPDSSDWNRHQGELDMALRETLSAFLAGKATDSSHAALPSSRFFPNAFRVQALAPASMFVQVYPGIGYHYLPSDLPDDIGVVDTPSYFGVTDLAVLKPLVLRTPQQFAVPAAPPATNTRIDIIEVRADRYMTDIDASRRELVQNGQNVSFDPVAAYKTLSFVLDGRVGSVQAPADSADPISYKIGVAANPGVAPATTAGYIKIGEIRVGTAVTAIEENKVIDRRKYLGYGGVIHGGARFRVEWNGGAPIVTLRSASLPPDVIIGAVAWPVGGPQRSALRFYVVAGEATEVAVNANVTRLTGTPSTAQHFATVTGPQTVGGAYILDADATMQTEAAACTPAVPLAIGAKVITFDVEGRYVDIGAINVTNALLEDTEIQVTLDIAYT